MYLSVVIPLVQLQSQGLVKTRVGCTYLSLNKSLRTELQAYEMHAHFSLTRNKKTMNELLIRWSRLRFQFCPR